MWSAISTADVAGEFTPAEQATLVNIQGSSDSLGGILTRTVNTARGSIQAGGNGLDAAGLIPDQVRAEVIAIARWRWLISFPALKSMQTKDRKDAHDDAIKFLREVAGGHPKIEAPVTPIATTGSLVTMPSIGRPKLRHFRHEDGI